MLSPPSYAKEYQPQVFGFYKTTEEQIYDRPVYQSEKFNGEDGIWYCGDTWYIGRYADREACEGYAHSGWDHHEQCVENIRKFDWRVYDGEFGEWREDGNLAIRCA